MKTCRPPLPLLHADLFHLGLLHTDLSMLGQDTGMWDPGQCSRAQERAPRPSCHRTGFRVQVLENRIYIIVLDH